MSNEEDLVALDKEVRRLKRIASEWAARMHDLDPELYLRDLIRVLPHWPRDRYLELAAKYWAHTRALLDPRQLATELGALDVPDARPLCQAE